MADREEPSSSLAGVLWVFVSLAGVTIALTWLFLGMRAVMDIGGTCAEGGPFVVRQRCPHGIPLVMLGAIWGGLAFAGVYAWQTLSRGLPSFVGLLWPALFLSLGWNFFEYALDPPGGGGIVWGWLVSGVLFAIMGGLPLLAVVPSLVRQVRGREEPHRSVRPATVGMVRDGIALLRNARKASRVASDRGQAGGTPSAWSTEAAETTTGGGESVGTGAELVTALERLAALHRSGALDDAEYEAAKRRVLGTEAR